jgi:sec-independent protein translocase protein TatA
MGLGFWEMAILLAIVLVIFGAGKLPSAMSDIGKGFRAFKAGMKDEPVAAEPPQQEPAPPKPAEPLRLVDRRGDGG